MRTLQTQTEWCARVQWMLGILLAVMIVGFYAMVYRPNVRKQEDLRTQVANKRRDLSGNQAQVKILPDVLRAVSQMRIRLEKFDKKLPRQPELPRFINDMTEVSHQASLRKVEVTPGVPALSDHYAEWPIALKFEGDFQSVFSFLRQAEGMPRLTRVKGLKVKGPD
jgi:type IV pilus assembly protein PilO